MGGPNALIQNRAGPQQGAPSRAMNGEGLGAISLEYSASGTLLQTEHRGAAGLGPRVLARMRCWA